MARGRGAVTIDVPEVAGLDGAQGQPEGAIPVCCPPNSALIFDRRLLHTGTPNYDTQHERLLFIIGFGYRWLRARDGLYVEPAMARATCPVVKQLLGATSSSAGRFRPAADDMPLARWLHEHVQKNPTSYFAIETDNAVTGGWGQFKRAFLGLGASAELLRACSNSFEV